MRNVIQKSRFLIVGLLFSFSACLVAQSTYQVGILPSFTVTKKINSKWKLALNTQARFSAYEGVFEENNPSQNNFDYILTDISALANRKIGLNSSVSVGYLIRLRNGEYHHRLFQQFMISQKQSSFGIVQRFSTDQTFRPSQKTEFRFRYRIAFDRPLQGNKLNPKEFYLKVNNEYLLSLQHQEWSNEVRIIPFLGYAITDKKKVEVGIDYRFGSLGQEFLNHNFWLALNYYWSF